MKIAFIHDRIINIGGAELVFLQLIEKQLLEDIKKNQINQYLIFTAYSNRKFIQILDKNIQIKSGIPMWILAILRIGENSNNKIIKLILDYRNLMFFFPLIMFIVSIKLIIYNPKYCIISSFAIAKNIFVSKKCNKYLYLHSPIQYAWSHYEEYLEKFKGVIKYVFKFVCLYIRLWDKQFTNFNAVYFNSNYTKDLSNKIYGIKGKIQFPQIISKQVLETPVSYDIHNYYIYVGRIVRFVKEVDKIINLFNNLNENLLICGQGPDKSLLIKKAKQNIIFIDFIEGENKINLIKKAKGAINLTKESFGIFTAESLALGVPVFGYNKGATVELVDKYSGLLINSKDEKSIYDGFIEFKQKDFDRNLIKSNFLKKYLN